MSNNINEIQDLKLTIKILEEEITKLNLIIQGLKSE